MSKKSTNFYTISNRKQNELTQEKEKMLSDVYLRLIKNVISSVISVIFYIGVVALIANLGKRAYNFAYPIFGDVSVDATPGRSVKVTVSKKDRLSDISAKLKEKGVIENEESFYIRGKLSINKNRTIEPGTYMLNTSENYGEILNILTNAEEIEQ